MSMALTAEVEKLRLRVVALEARIAQLEALVKRLAAELGVEPEEETP